MKITNRYLLFLLLVISLIGCEEDDEQPKGKYETGVLVINEGNFSANNGSVTWYDPTSKTAEQNIFKAPGNTFAGKVLQSLTISGDKAYAVANGEHKIEVLDAKTFQSVSTIMNDDIFSPRYVQVIGNKAYISVWGPFDSNFMLVDSYVLVYDLNTNIVVTTIDTDEGTENLLYDGKYLYASNYNYGASNTVAVIDPQDNSLVKQITLDAGPAGMTLDSSGKLWVITTGNYLGNDGKLFRINTTTLAVDKTIELGANPNSDLDISSDKQSIIYSVGNSIYKIGLNESSANSASLVVESDATALYAIGVNPANGDIYVGDAVDFASPGTVFVYGMDGTLKHSFGAGIDPGQFVFRK